MWSRTDIYDWLATSLGVSMVPVIMVIVMNTLCWYTHSFLLSALHEEWMVAIAKYEDHYEIVSIIFLVVRRH